MPDATLTLDTRDATAPERRLPAACLRDYNDSAVVGACGEAAAGLEESVEMFVRSSFSRGAKRLAAIT